MNVLFVMPQLRAGGGLTRSTLDLSSALRALDIEISIACLSDPRPSMREEFERRQTSVTVLPRDQGARIRALRRLVERGGTDVVHTATTPATIIARLAIVGLPTALVTSIINTREATALRGKRRVAFRKLYQWTHPLTDCFHANSFAAKSYAAAELGIPPWRITVIERGRDPRRLGSPSIERRLRARAALGIHPETPVILTAGRHEPQKDQLTLLAAFDRLAAVDLDALLLIAGREGRSTSLLLDRRELSAHGNRVHVLGLRDDLPELMAAADVFACPSAWEGFGGTAIEAMALGLPVVASDIPVLREVVTEGETGVFARVGDPDAFAVALSGLLRDPGRARSLGANGRRQFLDRFTIERSAERMRNLYAELRAAHGTVPARVTAARRACATTRATTTLGQRDPTGSAVPTRSDGIAVTGGTV